ncbi:hypothetical protein RhiirA5_469055 [Rhizophagus irregularis]|uniref:TPX2 C-terminal domain-containing protein n=1 Tax=Rhizophagus irregularis TaxID=588596 RepID=A0A2N0NRB2_9GLOM|nr:hypothetical protein RhiirA5_469055 [Rhizophagus irregularis]
MDATNFNNDKPEVGEKFEYMKDVSRVMSASSTQSPQTKIYLAKNSGGIQIRNAEEIRRLRANLVHHAQPIRYYTPINIKPSNKKPTRPISPMIGEKRRKYRDSLSKHV